MNQNEMDFSYKKIAIIHDYFNQFGGAEKVVEVWLEMYPEAEIFTSVFIPENFASSPSISKAWQEKRIKTSFLQGFFTSNNSNRNQKDGGEIAGNKNLKYFKHLFWLFPIAMSFLKVCGFDFVLISSTYCAKNVNLKTNPDTKIVHYCHSPTRFLHGLVTETDHSSLGLAYRILIPFFAWWLKILDLKAVKNLNNLGCIWLANSKFIQQTILNVYKTESIVVFPPIELDRFLKNERKIEVNQPFYLCHGRISFHKRIDLAIKACLQLKKRLLISGTSGLPQEMDLLKKIVEDAEKKDPSLKGLITFLGRTTDQEFADLMQSCLAFLFPGKEDFGIAPIEMLAAGVALIAYKAGGALEYVKDWENGVFFDEQSVESLSNAIIKFEQKNQWDVEKIKQSSLSFSRQSHQKSIQKSLGL